MADELANVAERAQTAAPAREPVSVHAPRGVAAQLLKSQASVGNQATLAFVAAIQPKLAVGAADDPLEAEADRLADRVVQTLRVPEEPGLGLPALETRLSAGVHRSYEGPLVGAEGGEVDADAERAITSARGGGAPLPEGVRDRMEGAFGADLTGIRVHTDSGSSALNRKLQAKAFTVGNDIFFDGPVPDTNTSAGQHLVAHELAHTIQQGGDGARRRGVQRKLVISGKAVGKLVAPREIKAAMKTAWPDKDQDGIQTLYETVDQTLITDDVPHSMHDILKQVAATNGLPEPPEPVQTATIPKKAAAVAAAPVLTGAMQLYADLQPTDLDKGKQFLKRLRDARPAGVNDATSVGSKSNMSNCALTTIGALVNKSASEATVSVQQAMGGRAPAGADKLLQKETMWATQLLPATLDPLKAAGIIETIDVPGYSEGRAEIIGNAQFYGMMKYLESVFQVDAALAGGAVSGADPGTPTSYKLYRHGEPGAAGDKQAALVATMKTYPSGTRFAVFVYSAATDQHTRQHWIYAELFGSTVVFSDYQKNERKAKTSDPVVEELDKFPLSPDANDAKSKKGFDSGSFIAIVPVFGDVAPVGITDVEITPDKVDSVLAEAEVRLATLTETHEVAGPTSGSLELAPTPADTSLRIPSPKLVKNEVEALITTLGVAPETSLGPDPAKWHIFIVGHPKISFATGAATIDMESLNEQTDVIDETGAKTAEKAYGGGNMSKSDPYSQSVSAALPFISGQSALASDGMIFVNPTQFHFPDLIHEVFHTYSAKSSADIPFNEGCTEIFASMVSEKIRARSDNLEYVYSFNVSYMPYIARAHQLVDVIGLDGLADVYFSKEDTVARLATKLEEARPDTKDPQPGKTEKKSLDLAARLTKKAFFPGGFDSAIAELTASTPPAPVIGAPAPAKPAWSDDYEQHNVAFAGAVDAERGKQAAAKKLPSGVPETGPLDAGQTTKVVEAASTQVQIDSNAATLRELYPKLATATGAPYVQLAAYIEYVERTLATLRNTTYEEIHTEFAKSVVVTFEFTDADGEVEKGDSVYMVGTQPELGSNKESRAIPLHKRGASFQSAPIDIINKFGSYLVLQFLVRTGSTIKKRYEIASVDLPKAKTATVTGDATGVTAR